MSQKLTLSKETVQVLTHRSQAEVAGALPPGTTRVDQVLSNANSCVCQPAPSINGGWSICIVGCTWVGCTVR